MSGPALLLAAVVAAGLHADGTSTAAPAAQTPPPAANQTPGDKSAPGTAPAATNQSPGTKPAPEQKPAPGGKPAAPAPAEPAGQGAPALILSPMQTTATVTVRVPIDDGATAATLKDDLKAGLLTSTGSPDLRIVPRIEAAPDAGGAKPGAPLALTVSGLVAFGDLTVPLIYKGRQVDTLRFQKPGLIVRPPAGGIVAAQQTSENLLLVLENSSEYAYDAVRARVRFQGIDECRVTTDQPGGGAPPPAQTWRNWIWRGLRRAPERGNCDSNQAWSAFAVRPSSQVTLAIPLYDAWFKDLESGLTRNASRAGVLTLRYYQPGASAADAQFVEQSVPLTVRFDARATRLFLSTAWVFMLLLFGALSFLLLRISIPNYRRKKALKDKLNEARAAAARISDQVNSQLRVLIRVERLALDQQRREGWVLLPGFDEQAARVERGLATLNRKIGFVERLDAASCRRDNLAAGSVAPTRLDIIDRNLQSACETLKLDQLGDADWLSIQQQLEAADKALNEPTPEEKQAFEALLSQRWTLLRKHFDPGQNSRGLKAPPELDAFKACFPLPELLPEVGDAGGKVWIESVGVVRADLQLTALELLRDLHFLTVALDGDKWKTEKEQLCKWLCTPAIANLRPARQLLQQMADGTTPQNLVCALTRHEAYIDMDPQYVSPNQTVRLTVRFYDQKLNDAPARGAILCEWRFNKPTVSSKAEAEAASAGRFTRLRRWIRNLVNPESNPAPAPVAPQGVQTQAPPPDPPDHVHTETGWRVHRYFQPEVAKQTIEVAFFRDGKEIPLDQTGQHYSKVVRPQERLHNRKDRREKWLRFGFQTVQMFAVLLVPLITLAMSTAGEPASGSWWDLIGLGFGSEAIRGVLTAEQTPPTT